MFEQPDRCWAKLPTGIASQILVWMGSCFELHDHVNDDNEIHDCREHSTSNRRRPLHFAHGKQLLSASRRTGLGEVEIEQAGTRRFEELNNLVSNAEICQS
jgi:hypothetical protein